MKSGIEALRRQIEVDWRRSQTELETAVEKHGISREQLKNELWPHNRFQSDVDWKAKLYRLKDKAGERSIREDADVDKAFLRFLNLACELQELMRWIAARLDAASE